VWNILFTCDGEIATLAEKRFVSLRFFPIELQQPYCGRMLSRHIHTTVDSK